MKSKLFAISAVFALLGAEAPQWFSKPSIDANSLYGFGVGSNIMVAKQNALIDLTSSIQSSVDVVFEREIKRTDTDISSLASQKFSVRTKMMDLLNAEVKQAECVEKQCYALIEIPKSKLIKQLKQKIELSKQTMSELNSPFDYQYKQNTLYPEMLSNYALYTSLGGGDLNIPQGVGEKPSFDLSFRYDGEFPKSFKSILEKTIQDSITRFGVISSDSKWKINIDVYQEGKSMALEVSATYEGNVIHNTSVYDTKKPSVSSSFFAKRLGVQVYKKMQKWGRGR